MPTYDYRCEACGHAFEIFTKKPTQARPRKCPECGGRARRLISGGAGFLFKGEGFYTTDYRSAEYRSRAEGEQGKAKPKSKDASGDAGKSDSKPPKTGSESASD